MDDATGLSRSPELSAGVSPSLFGTHKVILGDCFVRGLLSPRSLLGKFLKYLGTDKLSPAWHRWRGCGPLQKRMNCSGNGRRAALLPARTFGKHLKISSVQEPDIKLYHAIAATDP